MYTRSYSSVPRPATLRTPLPPDYGGTALTDAADTVKRPIPIPDEKPAYSEAGRTAVRDGISVKEKVSPEQYAAPVLMIGSDGSRASVQRTHVSDSQPVTADKNGEFGGTVTDKDVNAVLNSENFVVDPQKSVLFPSGVHHDDLLLIGLMLLIYSESKQGDGARCREALLLLAILFFSGM